MPRLVDVDALKLPDEYQIGPFDGPYYRGIGNGWNSALQACREHIDSTPTVSPDDVRGVGKWIHKPHVHGVVYCSECDYKLHIDNTNYCPNCGAKMKGAEENHTMDEFMYGQEMGSHSDGSL